MVKGDENSLDLDSIFGKNATFMTQNEEEAAVNDSFGPRLLGICLIVIAAACSAGTAVFNRALKQVDIAVVMIFHGMIGFLLALTIFCLQ